MTLSQRVAGLVGPDREVDAEIAIAMGMCLHKNQTKNGVQSDWGYDCDDCGANSWGAKSKDGFARRLGDPVPAFTMSLDAAMTVYPELPETVPSCPRKALSDALSARGL